MKIIKYNICREANFGTVEEPQMKEVFTPVVLDWNEINEEIAKREAHNGKYTIEDDERPDPTVEPTTDDVLYALLGV